MPTVKLSPVYNGYNDNNGVPNSGGKVTVNIAGTTTPATVYTDASGTVANTNPVILDSRGAPIDPIWLPAGQTYDLSMTTSADSPLTHVYNVSGINDTTVTVSEWILSGLTAEYISATSFKVPSDVTAFILPYTRLKIAYLTSYLYSSVSTAVYSAGFTTITVVNDGSSVLAAGIGAVSYSLISPVNLSIPKTAMPNWGTNLLINGDMAINQEQSGILTTQNTFPADQWSFIASAALAGSIACGLDSSIVPTPQQAYKKLINSMAIYTSVTKPSFAASDYLTLKQTIEGYSFNRIYLQASCVRFLVYAATAGNYSIAVQSQNNDQSCVVPYTVAQANTWQYVQLNVPACTSSGGWTFGADASAILNFTVDAGTNFRTATLNAWQAGNYLCSSTQAAGATVANGGLRIAGVSWQLGAIETTAPIIERDYQSELLLCKRYFQYLNGSLQGYGGTTEAISINFPEAMRAAPTITPSTVTYSNSSGLTFNTITTISAKTVLTITVLGNYSATYTSATLQARI